MNRLIFCLALTACIACGDKPAPPPPPPPPPPTPIAPSLGFEYREGDYETPLSDVFLVQNSKSLVIKNAMGKMAVLDTSQYADNRIPKSAILAAKCFWAGLEHWVIVQDSADHWVVKERFQDEVPEVSVDFFTVKALKKEYK